MSASLTIALCQRNPIVGDIPGNAALIRNARAEAAAAGADLVMFTELVVTGYPPEDLILKPMFQEAAEAMVREIAAETGDGGPAVLLGAPWREDGKLYNAALLLDSGEVAAKRYKYALPNYGVFDELRLFEPGPLPGPIAFRDVRLGVMVCEDMWVEEVSECLTESGAQIFAVINGSPYERDKTDVRLNNAVKQVVENGLPLIYLNQVGGQDELVFDGGSVAVDSDGQIACRVSPFCEGLYPVDVQFDDSQVRLRQGALAAMPELEASVYQALVTGVRDYVNKNGFKGVVLGLSGGIDSALTLAVAVDALGAERVEAVMMPYHYTSGMSLEDAEAQAHAMHVTYRVLSIAPMVEAFMQTLEPVFAGLPRDTTEENLQARCRGTLLMALSNKTGSLVLTTGNKSEMAVGYATLYGDMAGGFDVLKDVPKTLVFRLAEYRNTLGPVIPQRVIDRPPSAELAPDQKDEDSLPPYPVLDEILRLYIEHDLSASAIIAAGFDEDQVKRVVRLVDLNEYKGRQAAVGARITQRGFGRDRRYPITSGWAMED